jgi:hypothetical protein
VIQINISNRVLNTINDGNLLWKLERRQANKPVPTMVEAVLLTIQNKGKEVKKMFIEMKKKTFIEVDTSVRCSA